MKTKSIFALMLGLLLVLGAMTRMAAQSHMVVYMSDGTRYFYEVASVDSIGFAEHECVDLGLPSGTLWATCNVGANAPEEYGGYFAWGETQSKPNYSWSTYQYGTASDQLTKYCDKSSYGKDGFTDTKTVLDAEDDAATVHWGNGWRMPTLDEIRELCSNRSNIWTTQNGVKGRLFTGPNGNNLFLPAAGYYDGTSLGYAGSYGGYWSSTLSDAYPYGAYIIGLHSGNVNWGNSDRYYGQSVRPVVNR